jgi:hypothetical protein
MTAVQTVKTVCTGPALKNCRRLSQIGSVDWGQMSQMQAYGNSSHSAASAWIFEVCSDDVGQFCLILLTQLCNHQSASTFWITHVQCTHCRYKIMWLLLCEKGNVLFRSTRVTVMRSRALPGLVHRFTASAPQTAKSHIQMRTSSQQRNCQLPTLVCNNLLTNRATKMCLV